LRSKMSFPLPGKKCEHAGIEKDSKHQKKGSGQEVKQPVTKAGISNGPEGQPEYLKIKTVCKFTHKKVDSNSQLCETRGQI
jgi:hypothetical protein